MAEWIDDGFVIPSIVVIAAGFVVAIAGVDAFFVVDEVVTAGIGATTVEQVAVSNAVVTEVLPGWVVLIMGIEGVDGMAAWVDFAGEDIAKTHDASTAGGTD